MHRRVSAVSWVFVVAVVFMWAASPSVARADADSVNQYVKEAGDLVKKGPQFFDDAAAKLDLAEASMDDVPAGEKKALQAKIDGMKGQMKAVTSAADKEMAERDLSRALENVEGAIGNLATWNGASERLTELLKDPKTAAALGAPAVAAAQKKFDTFKKVHQGKALKEGLTIATQQVTELEKGWVENKAKIAEPDAGEFGRQNAVDDTKQALDQVERFFKELPADNAEVKKLAARVAKVRAENTAAGGEAGATTTIERINRSVENFKDEGEAMDAEKDGGTWADYKKNTSNQFNSPKTIDYVREAESFLANLEQEETYKANKDHPKVKALVDGIRTKAAAGRAKLVGFITKVVEEAEKDTITKDTVDEVVLLQNSINNAIDADKGEGKALSERARKIHENFIAAGDKAFEEKQAYYKKMTEQANKAWPDMMAKFTVADGFDPNNPSALKGKHIKIVADNLMGWRFKTGDFPYATKVNGLPVAGRYDPAVKAALEEVEAKIGRRIGDSDDDGQWTAIATVDGGTGKLVELVRSSGDVKVDGRSVGTVDATDEVPVNAPVITIVALKAGPVAVAQGAGVVREDGSVGAPVAAAGVGSSGGRGIPGRLFAILSGLVAVVAGAACLMKSKFAPLATNAGAVQLSEKVGGQNIQYVGLAAIALGVLGVLMNLLALLSSPFAALIGLLASAAMIVAGGVASRDFLEQRKLLPASAAPILTKFAIPAGIACAALGLLVILSSLF